MTKLKLAPSVENALLKRRIATLERHIKRDILVAEKQRHIMRCLDQDRMFARSLLHPNMERVYKAAMRWAKYRLCNISWSKSEIELARACARAAKMAKKEKEK